MGEDELVEAMQRVYEKSPAAFDALKPRRGKCLAEASAWPGVHCGLVRGHSGMHEADVNGGGSRAMFSNVREPMNLIVRSAAEGTLGGQT